MNYTIMLREVQRLRASGRQLPPAVVNGLATLDRLDRDLATARADLAAAMDAAQHAAIAGALDPAELDAVTRAKARVEVLEAAMLAQLQAAHAAADAAGVLPPRRTRPGSLPTARAGAFN